MKNTTTSTTAQAGIVSPEYLATLHEAENNAKRLRHLLTELIELFPQLLGGGK